MREILTLISPLELFLFILNINYIKIFSVQLMPETTISYIYIYIYIIIYYHIYI